MTTSPAPRVVPVSADADAAGPDSVGKRGNALSNKLTSVLSSSYANPEIRDALRQLLLELEMPKDMLMAFSTA